MIGDKIYQFLFTKFGFVGHVLAEDSSTSVGIGLPKNPSDPTTVTTKYSSWQDYISDIYRLALYLGATLAFIMIIYAAFEYIGSGGDSAKINKAKEYLIGALIGLAMLYLINYLAYVLNIQGIETTTS
ncbi:MAG: hypothetical protein WC523_07530 [Patescibacteria group bacterium]|jgi:hypothetical protein